jgi:hypothetical protein
VGDDIADRIFSYAMGLGEARTKDAETIEELVALAGNDRRPLREALKRTKALAAASVADLDEERDDAAPPEAAALVASRLLAEALESLDARSG